ncbi:MAG: hypothetical protein FWG99_00035 [Treponema sp.]|nr:hypothetical protein [Treponema sp.]
MKKFLILTVMIAVIAVAAFSIDDDWYETYPAYIEPGDVLLNVGVGFGVPYIDAVQMGTVVSVDVAVPLGGLAFSLGGSAGFNVSFPNDARFFLPVAFRFGWHPNLGFEKFALYAVATAAIPFVWGKDPFNVYWPAVGGIAAGFRFFFTPSFALYTEAGYGLNLLVAGVGFRF